MSALFPITLATPRQFVGTIDATADRCTRTARTLEEAFGPGQRSSTAVLETPDTPRMDRADRIVVRGSAFAAACLVIVMIAERVL